MSLGCGSSIRDGSEAELSGNGAREAILYLRRPRLDRRRHVRDPDRGGPIAPTITSELSCALDLGRASTASRNFPSGGADGRGTLTAGGREWDFQHV